MNQPRKRQRKMSYGKGDVLAYRTYVKPLEGVKEIPESNFSGRNNIVFAVNVSVEIGGKAFLPSFTSGDNSMVIATDSMKNFILKQLGSYRGCTMEGFLYDVGTAFLKKYAHVETVKLTGEEIPFTKTFVSQGNAHGDVIESDVVFNHSRAERAKASFALARKENGGYNLVEARSGIVDLQLIKVSGNSFVGFIRDEYTTLPEDSNRPLYIYLNMDWEYEDPEASFGEQPLNYVAAEQVRDIASSVFHEMETSSIQNLIYHIGRRVLTRFPQLCEVFFQSQNHTWDTVVAEIPGSPGKVYTEPRPPYGFQRFAVTREDL